MEEGARAVPFLSLPFFAHGARATERLRRASQVLPEPNRAGSCSGGEAGNEEEKERSEESPPPKTGPPGAGGFGVTEAKLNQRQNTGG